MASIKCPNCKNDYNTSNRQPFCLPCRGIICSECIERNYTHPNNTKLVKPKLICPFDSLEHSLDSLEREQNIMRIVDFIELQNKSKSLWTSILETKESFNFERIRVETEELVKKAKNKIDRKIDETIQELNDYKINLYNILDSQYAKINEQMESFEESNANKFDEIDKQFKLIENQLENGKTLLVEIEKTVGSRDCSKFTDTMRQFDETKNDIYKIIKFCNRNLDPKLSMPVIKFKQRKEPAVDFKLILGDVIVCNPFDEMLERFSLKSIKNKLFRFLYTH